MVKYTSAHWGSYRIEDDKLVGLHDDPRPSRIGRGWVSAARDEASRVLEPSVRRGWLAGDKGARRGDDHYVAVSWEKATRLVADEIARIRAERGNEAIYAGSYGWASAGRFHHAQSQLRRFMNMAGGYVSSRNTYSFAAAEVLLPHVTGMTMRQFEDTTTSWPLVAEHCELLVAFGGISGRTAQITSSGTSRHEVEFWQERLRARLVNISPLASDMHGAEWISLRPNTDTALILALCHTLLEENLHDKGFLGRYTSGWEAFRDYLQGSDGTVKNAEWAAPICDVPPPRIRALARDMAQRKTMISMAWGLQRADHGEQPLWAGLALASMLGQIGRPGTGFAFGYGSTTPIGRPSKIYRWPSVEQGTNRVRDFIPVSRIADMLLSPGEAYLYNGETRAYPDIRMVYWAGGNPFHHHQDLNRLAQAWTRPETVIVHENSWTATAQRADIVLPVNTALERDDFMMNRQDPTLLYMSAMFPPMGRSRTDHEIFGEIASHLGFESAFTENRDEEAWLRHLWRRAQAVGNEAGAVLPDFDEFRQIGRFDMPNSDETRIQFNAFIQDPDGNPLGTESGRITIGNRRIAAMELPDCAGHPAWYRPVESLLDGVPGSLHLVSGQPATRLHSQNDRGSEAASDKIDGHECCRIHPRTASSRGILAGDVVKIWNKRGAVLAGAILDQAVREDCVSLATGAWYAPVRTAAGLVDLAGNPNVLTIDKGTSSLAQGTIAHTACVFVEKLPPGEVTRYVFARPRVTQLLTQSENM